MNCLCCGVDSGRKYCSKKCYDKEYRSKNHEKRIEADRKYYADNRKKILEQSRQYVENNKEQVNAYRHKWRSENKARKKSKDKKRYTEKRGEILDKSKVYVLNNMIGKKIMDATFYVIGSSRKICKKERAAIFISSVMKRSTIDTKLIKEAVEYAKS